MTWTPAATQATAVALEASALPPNGEPERAAGEAHSAYWLHATSQTSYLYGDLSTDYSPSSAFQAPEVSRTTYYADCPGTHKAFYASFYPAVTMKYCRDIRILPTASSIRPLELTIRGLPSL